jgi:DNA polymerase-3 subunit gamma/tau
LARKWRPQTFDEVVGQGHVTRTLKNAITAGRVAHAFLFVGPRGVGKTSLARIFAKSLNCANGPTVEPCGKCPSCTQIAAGSDMDVMEIDGASNTGVDNVRELREAARYAPTKSRFKVYVIDEVHMLSTGAFNALLKTLEEPPPHVKFIFATTEVQKVPATILSRCQRFDLRRISVPDIAGHLGTIAKAEKVKLDDDALYAIARGAEGGLRDAESALDQLMAFCGKHITEADVLSVFGLVSRQVLEDLAAAVLKGDAGAIVRIIAEQDAGGRDLQRLALELLEHLRHVLVAAVAGPDAVDADIVERQRDAVRAAAANADPGRLTRIVDLLLELQGTLRFTLSRRTAVEVCLLRCAREATAVTLDEVLVALGAPPDAKSAPAPAAAPAPAPAAPPRPAAPPPAPVPEELPLAAPAPVSAAPRAGQGELGTLVNRWKEFLDHVAKHSALARTLLTDCTPVDVGPDKVVFALDPEFAARADNLTNPRTLQAVQRALHEMFRRPLTPEYRVGAAPPPPSSAAGQPKSKREWTENKAVKEALELFNGDITDIRS